MLDPTAVAAVAPAIPPVIISLFCLTESTKPDITPLSPPGTLDASKLLRANPAAAICKGFIVSSPQLHALLSEIPPGIGRVTEPIVLPDGALLVPKVNLSIFFGSYFNILNLMISC